MICWMALIAFLVACDEATVEVPPAIPEQTSQMYLRKSVGKALSRQCQRMDKDSSGSLQQDYQDRRSDICTLNTRIASMSVAKCVHFCSHEELSSAYLLLELMQQEIQQNGASLGTSLNQKHSEWLETTKANCETLGEEEQNKCVGTALENRLDWLLKLWNRVEMVSVSSCSTEPFLVAVDVGHPKQKFGATSARGRPEYAFNLAFSKHLVLELQRRGMDAFLIDSTGDDLSLANRNIIANQQRAQMLISIHHDSAQEQYLQEWRVEGKKQRYSDLFQGYSIFFSKRSTYPEQSVHLAQMIAGQLQDQHYVFTKHHAEKIAGENRDLVFPELGIYRWDGLGILKRATIPAVLLEVGVIINREEEERLLSSIEQSIMSSVVAEGISLYCQ